MTKLISNITECVYTKEIQFNNKIDLIIVICEQHGLYIITQEKTLILEKYTLKKLDNNGRKETWEMKIKRGEYISTKN